MTATNNNGFLAGSNLERILKAGHFAVTGELGPPQSADGEEIRHKATLLKGNCDAVNITDNQTAIVRMSSIGAGTIVVQEGLEPIIQMTCRDRNRLAIQSDLLGAYALGMRNLLALTGDHQIFGNHPTAKNVFDMDSLQLVRAVAQMRERTSLTWTPSNWCARSLRCVTTASSSVAMPLKGKNRVSSLVLLPPLLQIRSISGPTGWPRR